MYGYGFSLFLTNRAILAKANAGTPPSNTVAPLVTGSVSVGSTLTTTTGTWTGTPVITYTYQWKRGVSNIVGATNSSYILQAADVGQSIKCTVTATNAFGSAAADSNAITATWEADAQAFITAASITDPTQQSAINNLVIGLKADGLWTKMKAIYPFVGGTASTHKFNLKNPLDTDAAFRLVFNGGWSHNSNGITGNGVNTTASTFIVSNSIFNASNGGLSFYCRNTVNENKYDIGYNNFGIALYANESYFMWGDGFPNVARLATRGFYQLNRISSVSYGQFNNSIILTNPSTGNVLSNIISIGSTGAGGFSSRNYAFASISDGLTNTEAANFYTRVQAFNTTLNRQV